MARFPDIVASQTSFMQVKHRVSEAQFGNGFRQRIGHAGARKRSWHVKFVDGRVVVVARVDQFRTGLAGSRAFFWQPPNSTNAQFVCAEWKMTPVNHALASLEALFIEA